MLGLNFFDVYVILVQKVIFDAKGSADAGPTQVGGFEARRTTKNSMTCACFLIYPKT